MYDATNRASFDNLQYWLSEIQQHCTNKNIVKMLIGSKLDAPDSRIKVPRSEGEIFAIEHSMLFYEISSKNRMGISECFDELVQSVLENPFLSRETSARTPAHSPGGEGVSCNTSVLEILVVDVIHVDITRWPVEFPYLSEADACLRNCIFLILRHLRERLKTRPARSRSPNFQSMT